MQTEKDLGSPASIGQMALRNPSGLADEFGIGVTVRERRARRVGEGDPLTIDFGAIRDERSLVVVDWGDGPEIFDDDPARHRYRNPGRYRVRAAVLRGATLMKIEFAAVVRAREDARRVEVEVPRFDPPSADPDADDPVIPRPLD